MCRTPQIRVSGSVTTPGTTDTSRPPGAPAAATRSPACTLIASASRSGVPPAPSARSSATSSSSSICTIVAGTVAVADAGLGRLRADDVGVGEEQLGGDEECRALARARREHDGGLPPRVDQLGVRERARPRLDRPVRAGRSRPRPAAGRARSSAPESSGRCDTPRPANRTNARLPAPARNKPRRSHSRRGRRAACGIDAAASADGGAGVVEDARQHLRREPAREGVLLAGMEGAEDQRAALRRLDAAPWPNAGRGRSPWPRPARTRQVESQASLPSVTTTRTRGSAAHSASRNGRQASNSCGVGLLSGGAQRTAAVIQASRRVRPSRRDSEIGRLAKPAACIAVIRKQAGSIAGEHPAGAVGAVRAGRQADDQQRAPRDRRSRAAGGPSRSRRDTRRASPPRRRRSAPAAARTACTRRFRGCEAGEAHPRAAASASACSCAWYELRTSGPDSTCPKPRSERDRASARRTRRGGSSGPSAGASRVGRRYWPMVRIVDADAAQVAQHLDHFVVRLRRGRPSGRSWSGCAARRRARGRAAPACADTCRPTAPCR